MRQRDAIFPAIARPRALAAFDAASSDNASAKERVAPG
jgi:hypothetical protein